MLKRLHRFKRPLSIAAGLAVVAIAGVVVVWAWPERCPFDVRVERSDPSEVYYGDFGTMRLLTIRVRTLKETTITFDRDAKLTAHVGDRWAEVAPDPYWLESVGGIAWRPHTNAATTTQALTNRLLTFAPVRVQTGVVKILVPASADACRLQLRYHLPQQFPLAVRVAGARYDPQTKVSAWVQSFVRTISQRLYDRLWPAGVTSKPTWKTNTVELTIPKAPVPGLLKATNEAPPASAQGRSGP